MTDRLMHDDLTERPKPDYQHAEIALRIGTHSGLRVTSNLTSRGLVAIGIMVSSIILSTAVLVRVVVREGPRAPARPLPVDQPLAETPTSTRS